MSMAKMIKLFVLSHKVHSEEWEAVGSDDWNDTISIQGVL